MTLNYVVGAIGTGGGVKIGALVTNIFIDALLSRANKVMASRPADMITPDAALMKRYGKLARANLANVGHGERLDLFEGFDPHSRTVETAVGIGACLEPEYPDGRAVFFFDRTQPVCSGDLAIVEGWGQPQYSRGNRYSGGGVITRERVLLAKYAEHVGGRWVLHSNDDPFFLPVGCRFLGRVVAVAVVRDEPAIKRSLRDWCAPPAEGATP